MQFSYEGAEPLRLDRFLVEELPEHSRSRLQKIISEGFVTVNGSPARPSLMLRGGEVILVSVPPPRKLGVEPEPIPLSVLYEDEHVIAVDKPAGMVVHPAPGHYSGTLVSALLAHCKELSGIGGVLRPGIVHRLDIGTSGVLIAAKSDAAHRSLAEQFKARSVVKSYLAVVFGCPSPKEGEIDLAIGRDRKNRKKISALTDRPREALTRYYVEENFSEFALVRLRLVTGRTHQVRVHMGHVGHPLVGDSLYGGARWRGVKDAGLRLLARRFGRPALHSAGLCLQHPVSGKELSLQAPAPNDFTELLDSIRNRR